MAYLSLAAQLALAGVFIVSGVAKLRAFSDTVDMWTSLLDRVKLPTAALARPASWALIVVEIATGAALLVPGVVSLIGLVMAAALLAGFTGLAVISARTTLDLNCACFGRATTPLGWRHVWRNLVLLAIAVTGLVSGLQLGQVSPELAGIAVAAVAALLVTVLAAFYDDIMDLLLDTP